MISWIAAAPAAWIWRLLLSHASPGRSLRIWKPLCCTAVCSLPSICLFSQEVTPTLGNAETQSRSALLHEIDKVSFAVNDLTLYLDTHPDCQEGLARFQKEAARRKELMNQYAKAYGPLTAGCVCDLGGADRWSLQDGPAPWEGGMI